MKLFIGFTLNNLYRRFISVNLNFIYVMGKTGIANLPLHGGKAPRWLFKRMVLLARGIIEVMNLEYGKNEFLKRISDPFWFQSLSCVLGFDWHSSGTTTVTCGALKDAIDPEEHGLAIVGGKGRASRNTLNQIRQIGEIFNLSTDAIQKFEYSSRMAAKVDNSAIQDGYNLYHHCFLISEDGKWGVIQQGINCDINYARRYHWCSEHLNHFVCDPHDAIIGKKSVSSVLNMVTEKSKECQKLCVDLVNESPRHLQKNWAMLARCHTQSTLDEWDAKNQKKIIMPCLNMPRNINWSKMKEIYDFQPSNYEQLLSIQGIGPNTIRALALIAELIYGEKPSWNDPVKFSFTVGGKDGVPFPVDRKAMDESTEILRQGIQRSKIGDKQKIDAIKRLRRFNNCSFQEYLC